MLENTRFLPHFLSVLKNAKDERVISQIEEDVLPLLFCYLVVSLPGLRERKLGGAWLMDFPIFECGLSSALGRMYLPGDWRNSFSLSTYKNLLSQLTVLDVPADMTAMHFAQSARTVFDVRPFKPLKVLGLSMRTLQKLPNQAPRKTTQNLPTNTPNPPHQRGLPNHTPFSLPTRNRKEIRLPPPRPRPRRSLL